MKELLLQYAQYNVWANKRAIDAMLKLDDGLTNKEVTSSFPSVLATVCHTWAAEFIWLQRLQLAEHPQWVGSDFTGTFEEACSHWQQVSADLAKFVEKQHGDSAFQHVLQYYDRAKVSHKTPVYHVLHHIFNHSTYHRGQLVTMLRQLGSKDIPATDFIAFVKKK